LTYFVFIYRPGPAWLPGGGILQQPLAAHFAYMEKLRQDGILSIKGPFKDNVGALGIIQAADFKSATALIEADSAVRNKVFKAELHPWHPSVPDTVGKKEWS
jgi:uncharacterized protein YciI